MTLLNLRHAVCSAILVTGLTSSTSLIAAESETPFYREAIDKVEQFDGMATLTEGVIQTSAIKFLIDNQDPKTPKVYFINSQFKDAKGKQPEYVKYHFDFAKKVIAKLPDDLDAFNNSTYFTNDLKKKKFIAGTLQSYDVLTKTKHQQFFGVQFYPQDEIAEETLLHAITVVIKKFQLRPLNFVQYGSQQTVKNITDDLKKMGIGIATLDQVYGAIPVIPMNKGKACGFVRAQSPGEKNFSEKLLPTDIAVFEELPLDLSVVAAVITKAIQDPGAHINLKSKERKTPNLVLRDEAQFKDFVKTFEDKPVCLEVTATGLSKPEIVTEAKVVADYQEKLKSKKVQKGLFVEDYKILSFDQMAKKYTPTQMINNGGRYGGKAAKLGFLAHANVLGFGGKMQKKMGYRLTPIGFGLPVAYYFKFVKANPELEQTLAEFIKNEDAQKNTNYEKRQAQIEHIQDLFYKASVPKDLADAVKLAIDNMHAEAKKFYPDIEVKKIKVRSSANVEDLPDFDGAGLHSSYSAKLKKFGELNEACAVKVEEDGVATKEEMDPKTVLCAIKGVYASLWNKRAVDERSFARITQASAGMGIAVNPTYSFRESDDDDGEIQEKANAVLITRIVGASGIYGYQMSINDDENLVTNPTPGTQSELLFASFLGDEKPRFSWQRLAKPKKDGPLMTKSLLSQKQLITTMDLTRFVEKAYCNAEKKYYPYSCDGVIGDPDKPKSLDIELKFYSDDQVLVKQVREFSGQ